MKAGKILAIVLGVVVILVVALVAFILSIDPNSYKGEIQAAVQKNTGRELKLDGNLGWTFFPSIGLSIQKVALSEPDGFAKGTTADIGDADVSVKLIPLLSGDIQVDGVSLKDVVVNIKAGDKTQAKAVAESENTGNATTKAPDLSSLTKLNLGSIALHNIQVNVLDKGGKATQQLVLDDLTLDGFAPGASSTLKARLHTVGPQQAVATLDAGIKFNKDLTETTLSRLAATVQLSGEGIAKPLQLQFATKGTLNMAAGSLDLSSLQLDVGNMVITGKLAAKSLFADPSASGSLAISKTDLRGLMERLGVSLPERADKTTLSDFALGFNWQYGQNKASISDLKGNLDDTKLTGSAKVNLAGAVPDMSLKLAMDKFDADRYLPPASDKPAQASTPAKSSPEIEPDLSALRGFKADANITLGALTINHVKLSNINLTATNDRGQFALAPLSAQLYSGKIVLSTQVDARKQPAKIAIQNDLSGVEIEPLLKDLMQSDKPLLAGTTTAKANLTAVGLTSTSLTQSLNGTANFQFRNGAVYGVNIAHELRKAGALLKGQSVPEEDTKKTDFAELSGSATFKNGKMNNPDLLLASPLLRVNGAGDIDLVKKSLDYGVSAKLVGTLKGQDGKAMDELKGVTLPIKITGSFDSPKVRPDMDALLKGKADQKIKEQKDKLKDKLSEKLGDLFKKKEGN